MSFELPCPEGWTLVKLSDLGEVNRGRSRHRPRDASHLYGGKYPFVQTGDVKASGGRVKFYSQTYSEDGLAQSRLWPTGTMCITIAANIAETGILQFPACFPDSVIGFIADEEKCNVYFIEYVFRLLRRRIQAQATGSVQDNINLQTLERILFPIPSIEEQNRIAKHLCAFDDKIETNHQINQTLEQIAQAIFKSWFVDFEPVKAKIAAREALLAAYAEKMPTATAEQIAKAPSPQEIEEVERQAAIKAISGAGDVVPTEQLQILADLFPNHLVESGLGQIPEGWEVKPLTEFGNVVCGKTPSKKKEEYYGSDIPFIKIPDMHGGAFATSYTEYLSVEGANSQNKKQIPVGAVCVSCIATVGKVLITHRDSHTNQQINSIVPQEQFLTEYLYFQMLNQNKLLHDLASGGSATLNLNTGNFSKIELLSPSYSALKAYQQTVSPLFFKILENSLESETLESLRDTLLPQLLSGEIELTNCKKGVINA